MGEQLEGRIRVAAAQVRDEQRPFTGRRLPAEKRRQTDAIELYRRGNSPRRQNSINVGITSM